MSKFSTTNLPKTDQNSNYLTLPSQRFIPNPPNTTQDMRLLLGTFRVVKFVNHFPRNKQSFLLPPAPHNRKSLEHIAIIPVSKITPSPITKGTNRHIKAVNFPNFYSLYVRSKHETCSTDQNP
jgi:hypothetical protein